MTINEHVEAAERALEIPIYGTTFEEDQVGTLKGILHMLIAIHKGFDEADTDSDGGTST